MGETIHQGRADPIQGSVDRLTESRMRDILAGEEPGNCRILPGKDHYRQACAAYSRLGSRLGKAGEEIGPHHCEPGEQRSHESVSLRDPAMELPPAKRISGYSPRKTGSVTHRSSCPRHWS